jgi:autotransporter translocation and assembly factor TamB
VFSWRNPAGLERADGGKGAGANLRLSLAATATADVSPDGRIAVSALQLRAGESTLSGAGEIFLRERSYRLAGEFSIPGGKASDYGWDYPLSWARLAGRWEAGGPVARQRVSVRMEAQSLSARALPPVPLVVKLEGDPADAVHFVADIPASAAKATATGTFTGPLSAEPLAVEAAVAVRDIDFSEGNRWITAALSPPGSEPTEAARVLAGLAGSGTGDLRISIAREAYSFTGSLHSPELRLKGIKVSEVSLEGGWSRSRSEEVWKATIDGKVEAVERRYRGKAPGQTWVWSAAFLDCRDAPAIFKLLALRPERAAHR